MRALLAAIVLVFATATVHAAPPGLTDPIEPDDAPMRMPVMSDVAPGTYVPSYRAQLAGMDGLVLGSILLSGVGSGAGAFAVIGMAGYLFSAPVIHVLHGSPERACGSLALRVLLPLVGAELGAQFLHGGDDLGAVVLGGAGGVALAMVLDTAFLGGERGAPRAPAWVPAVRQAHGGYTVGLATSF